MFFRLVAFSCELQRNQPSPASTIEFLVVRVTEIEGLCFWGICWLSVFLLILFVLALLPWWELNEQKHLQASCFHRPRMDSVEPHAHPHPTPSPGDGRADRLSCGLVPRPWVCRGGSFPPQSHWGFCPWKRRPSGSGDRCREIAPNADPE